MWVFFQGNIPKYLITQKKKPKPLPPVCRLLSTTSTCMSTGGGAPPGSRTDQQLTPDLQTSWRIKWWTEKYRSQKRVSARWLGGVINWTLMHLCFCLSVTQPVRPSRGRWGRSRSGWQPWWCSTAEPRKGSPTLRRKRQTVPRRSPWPQSHLAARRLLMLGDGELYWSVLF